MSETRFEQFFGKFLDHFKCRKWCKISFCCGFLVLNVAIRFLMLSCSTNVPILMSLWCPWELLFAIPVVLRRLLEAAILQHIFGCFLAVSSPQERGFRMGRSSIFSRKHHTSVHKMSINIGSRRAGRPRFTNGTMDPTMDGKTRLTESGFCPLRVFDSDSILFQPRRKKGVISELVFTESGRSR